MQRRPCFLGNLLYSTVVLYCDIEEPNNIRYTFCVFLTSLPLFCFFFSATIYTQVQRAPVDWFEVSWKCSDPPFCLYRMCLHMLILLLQTSCDGKVASGTQVVFHEARLDPGLVTRLDRRHIAGSTGGLLQSYTFLKCHVLLSIIKH